MGNFSTIKIEILLISSTSSEYLLERVKHTQSTTPKSKVLKAAFVSINRLVAKENVVFTHSEVLLCHEDKPESFAGKWLHFETLM